MGIESLEIICKNPEQPIRVIGEYLQKNKLKHHSSLSTENEITTQNRFVYHQSMRLIAAQKSWENEVHKDNIPNDQSLQGHAFQLHLSH